MDSKAELRSRCSIASRNSWTSFWRISVSGRGSSEKNMRGCRGGLRLGGIDEAFLIIFYFYPIFLNESQKVFQAFRGESKKPEQPFPVNHL